MEDDREVPCLEQVLETVADLLPHVGPGRRPHRGCLQPLQLRAPGAPASDLVDDHGEGDSPQVGRLEGREILTALPLDDPQPRDVCKILLLRAQLGWTVVYNRPDQEGTHLRGRGGDPGAGGAGGPHRPGELTTPLGWTTLGTCVPFLAPMLRGPVLLVPILASAAVSAAGRTPEALRGCDSILTERPRSADGYQCLLGHSREHREEVGRLLAARLRARPDDPWALLYAGLFHSYAGENVPERQYARAVQGFRREADPSGLVPALLSQLGQRCFAEDRCDEGALELLEEAERLAEAGDDLHPRRLAQLWWLRWGIKRDDLAVADRAVQRLDALPGPDPPWMAAQLVAQKAFLAGVLRAHEQKLALYSELLVATPPGSAARAGALGGRAAAAASLALRGAFDRAEAEALLRSAIDEQDRAGLRISLTDPGAGSLATRAHLALLLGPGDGSLRLLDEALAGYAHTPGWTYPWYAWWLKARYLSEGPTPRLDLALATAEQGVEHASGPGSGWECARSVLMRAHMHWRAGRRDTARADAFAALQALEELRQRQGDVRIRMRYEDSLAFAYELVAGSLLDHPGEPTEAELVESLGTMERFRARGLLETLVRGPDAPGDVQRTVHAAHTRLLDRTLDGAERVAATVALRQAERERARRPGDGATDASPVPSLDALRSVLRPGEALVSFQQWAAEPDVDAPIEDASSWAILLTREHLGAVRIPGAREIEPQVKLWMSLLERRDGSESAGANALSSRLLGPVVQALPGAVTSLVIVPDGILHRMPLEALPISPGGPLLAARYEVSLVPSLAVWLRLRSAPARSQGTALALADPPLSLPARAEMERSGFQGALELPRSREEGARALWAMGGDGTLLVGAAATEEALRRAPLGRVSLLHVASHALLDLGRPERSALLLGPTSGEDGRVTLDEVRDLRLDRALVVLGACRTSGGTLRRGEGMLSLARAFVEAGARAVIGNLTPARDDESAALFAAFYERIERGEPAGTALTLAKRTRIRAGAPPATWASTVLLGDGRVAPHPSPRQSSALPVVGLAALGLGLLGALALARRWASRGR